MNNTTYRSIAMTLAVVVVIMAAYIVFLHTQRLPAAMPALQGFAGASSQQNGFPAGNLNDGTVAAWGSDETLSDIYAYITLENPAAVARIRLSAFSPEGRNHLRDVRLVAAASLPRDAAGWKLIGFSAAAGGKRLEQGKGSAQAVTLPAVNDEEQIVLTPDKSDSTYGEYRVWGVACLRSRGDVCNQLDKSGNGMYLREMRLEK